MIQTTTDNNVWLDYQVSDDEGNPPTDVQEVQVVVRNINDLESSEEVLSAQSVGGVYVVGTKDFPGAGLFTVLFRAKVAGEWVDGRDRMVRIYQGVYAD